MIAILNSLIQNGHVNDINTIDGVYIILDPTWKKIAVSVSGGADSALLLFLLCDIIDKKQLTIDVDVITNIRMWKDRPWQRKNSLDVFNYIKAKFKKIKFYRHENFIAPELEHGSIGKVIPDRNGKLKSGDQISTISHAEYICYLYGIDAWFAGITKNPPGVNVTSGMTDRNNNFNGNIEPLIVKQNNITMCHPFRFADKRWIMRQYKNYKLENLLVLTRSCEGDNKTYPEVFKGLDVTTYKDTNIVPECGQCFWCQERVWGLANDNR
jgi:hypothetical protein